MGVPLGHVRFLLYIKLYFMYYEKGRHVEYGRRTTDLAGVFSIEMFIKLASNETCGKSADWLPSI